MCLVGVRSTSPDAGLVAILVERGGPGMLAVPVGVREGLSLAAGEVGPATSWTGLMSRCAEAAETRLSHVRLDVDDDARLVARLVVEAPACADKVMAVPCTPGEGLLLSGYHRFPVHASSSLTRLRAVDLSDDYGAEQFEQWRRILLRTNDLTDDTRD